MAKIASQRTIVLILLLVLIALTVGHLNDAIWTDEQRTLYYAGAAPQYGPTTVGESLERIIHNRWQAPGYYLLIWAWGRVAGWSVFALRLPALWMGLLATAALYAVVRHYGGKTLAFYAAFTMALNAFFVNFLHDMRAYMLLATLAVFMLWLYSLIITKRHQSMALYVLFTVILVGLLYTHYFAFFAIAALGLCHLLFQRKQPSYWPVNICFAIAAISFLPWVQVLASGTELAAEATRSLNNLEAIEGTGLILYFFSNGSIAFLLLLMLFALRETHPALRFTTLWAIVSYGLVWGATRFVPAFTEVKYVLFLWPGIAALAAAGIERLSRLHIPAAALLGLWLVMFIGSLQSPHEQQRIHPWYAPPLDELAEAVIPHTEPKDAVLFVLPPLEQFAETPMLDYYFYGADILRTAVIRDTYATTDSFFKSQVLDAIEDAERVWITYDVLRHNWRLGKLETSTLPSEGYAACGVAVETPHIYAALFARQPDNDSLSFTADEDSTVDMYVLSEPEMSEDGRVSVALGWFLPEELGGSPYSVGLHVEDAQGNFVSQADIGITQAGFGCNFRQVDMSHLPDGEYIVKVTVYNWQTGERLDSVAAAADGKRPVIGTVRLPVS